MKIFYESFLSQALPVYRTAGKGATLFTFLAFEPLMNIQTFSFIEMSLAYFLKWLKCGFVKCRQCGKKQPNLTAKA